MRECETGLGHGERTSAGTNRRNHTPDGVGTNREREGSERARGRAKKQRRGSWAEGKPKTRGCGTGAGIYEQAGTRARTKERAEGAGGKLVWGCFAFLMGLERVNAAPSSRKTPFVDKIRRYVSHFRADRSRESWRFHKRPGHNFLSSERVFSLE